MQSGSVLNYWTKGRRYAKQLAKNLGLESEDEAKILDFLRGQSVEDLVAAQEKMRVVIINTLIRRSYFILHFFFKYV